MEGEPDHFQHTQSSFSQRIAAEGSHNKTTTTGQSSRQLNQERWQSSAFFGLHSTIPRRFRSINLTFQSLSLFPLSFSWKKHRVVPVLVYSSRPYSFLTQSIPSFLIECLSWSFDYIDGLVRSPKRVWCMSRLDRNMTLSGWHSSWCWSISFKINTSGPKRKDYATRRLCCSCVHVYRRKAKGEISHRNGGLGFSKECTAA